MALWLGGVFCQSALLLAYSNSADTNPASFVNWESPHVHPLDVTPDGKRLLAVNTADNRLEVFDISSTSTIPVSIGSVPVGLDPISVRARTNTEAWVVNHISDSISIVNLATLSVVATLQTEDEPADVAFAGTPQRAFVTGAQASKLMVFDPQNRAAAPIVLNLAGEEPRALAVSPDGNKVYVAFFESGNKTTIVGTSVQNNAVNSSLGPYGGQNPPPNDGVNFKPAINPNLPVREATTLLPASPPKVGIIVRKSSAGSWMDDNNHDWTALVSGNSAAASNRVRGWDVLDNDVAVVDANTLTVSYLTGMMNLVMAVGVNPATSQVTAVGTEATNHIRFEPILKGRFLRVNAAFGDPATLSVTSVVDLNGHLDYSDAQIATQSDPATASQSLRDLSIGDPRAIVWNRQGTLGYVAGMGSNNVVVIDSLGSRSGSPIVVGEGPTGLVLQTLRNRLYVLNKFGASISVVDTTSNAEIARTPFFDPTPAVIKTGRKHLYDTHRTSGLGHIACASCHVDGKSDRLSWDLGNPAGEMKSFGQNCGYQIARFQGACSDFHPMKGPMFTQTLQDIIGKEPHHWRGDKTGLEEFSGAFTGLQGDDVLPSAADLQEFEDFLATIYFPPNPFRNFDNTLPTSLALPGQEALGRFAKPGLNGLAPGAQIPPGNAQAIVNTYLTRGEHLSTGTGGNTCVVCHVFTTGQGGDVSASGTTGFAPIPPGPSGEHHLMSTGISIGPSSGPYTFKVPHLRGLHKKVGFTLKSTPSRAGFGFFNDGGATLPGFLAFFPPMADDQEISNFIALLLAYSGSDLPASETLSDPLRPPGVRSQDTHAAVGKQVTFNGANNNDAALVSLLSQMTSQADAGKVGVVAKAVRNGLQRGWVYLGGGVFQGDRIAGSTVPTNALRSSAVAGSELTFTVVPYGTQRRIGIDRDNDGILDGDDPTPAGVPLNIQAFRLSTPRVISSSPTNTGH
jgi:YVTN family beta-propeller protein